MKIGFREEIPKVSICKNRVFSFLQRSISFSSVSLDIVLTHNTKSQNWPIQILLFSTKTQSISKTFSAWFDLSNNSFQVFVCQIDIIFSC